MHEQVAGLERAFAALSDEDRRIIRLIYIDGVTHAQAGEQLGCNEVNSRKLLSRALARLSKLIS